MRDTCRLAVSVTTSPIILEGRGETIACDLQTVVYLLEYGHVYSVTR